MLILDTDHMTFEYSIPEFLLNVCFFVRSREKRVEVTFASYSLPKIGCEMFSLLTRKIGLIWMPGRFSHMTSWVF